MAESFAAMIAVTLVTPPLFSPMTRVVDRLLIALAAIASLSLVLFCMPVTGSQYWNCIAIAASVVLLIAGSASLLRNLSQNAFAISMGITVVMLLWLSWPIWLSELLAGHERIVNFLAAIHPLLAINGQLLDQGIWTERPLMYAWTGLNQDVSYAVPTTASWCILLHGGTGGIALMISWQIDRYRRAAAVVGS